MLLLVGYIITVFIYFFFLRLILKKGMLFEVSNLLYLIMVLLIGFIPLLNLIFTFFLIIDSNLCSFYRIDINRVLKKILFIKDERDERWR